MKYQVCVSNRNPRRNGCVLHIEAEDAASAAAAGWHRATGYYLPDKTPPVVEAVDRPGHFKVAGDSVSVMELE